MKRHAALFRALADETRLAILGLLAHHGELCVCDVESVLEISQSKASRHLRYLLHAGLVADRRDGPWMRYRIEPADEPARQLIEALLPLLAALPPPELHRRLDEWIASKQRVDGACSLLREGQTSSTQQKRSST